MSMNPDNFLEVIDLFKVGAVNTAAFSENTIRPLLYVKHLDGRREIFGGMFALTGATNVELIDLNVLGEDNLRTDQFIFTFSHVAPPTITVEYAWHQQTTGKILLEANAPILDNELWTLQGTLYTTNVVEISKNLRDK